MENPKHRYGQNHGRSKLMDDQIEHIIYLYSCGLTQREIAEQFKVNQRTISDIIRRKSWKHLKLDK
jgi:DNA-binding NarL/FixJ family response regulator